jgi:beta-lactamase regulating signal transducer with metallopeptidase domain/photosystem II stability/assembly factor-like uncharacterized protein
MNDLNALFYTILVCSLSGTIVGAAILLFRKLTERLISPSWKCAIWALLVVLLLVPFKIPLDLGGANAIQLSDTVAINNIKQLPDYFSQKAGLQNTQSQMLNGSTNTQTDGNNISAANPQQSVQPVNNQPSQLNIPYLILNTVIPITWLLGATIMLAFMLIGNIRLNRNIKRTSTGNVSENILQAVNQCSSVMKLKKPLKVVVQSYIKTPVLAGVFQPKIVLPAYASGLDEETIKYIIMHELSHFKRYDMFTNYLLIIAQAIHWFNPFVWYCFKKMRQDMELATDALVLSRLQSSEHKQYAMSLLNVIGTEQGLTMTPKMLCMVDSPKNIKRRICMIKLNEFFRKRAVLISLACILVIMLVGAVFFTIKPNAAADSSSNNLQNVKVNMPGTDSIKNVIYSGYKSITFINKNVGYVVGDLGTGSNILQTTDGGNTWEPIYSAKSYIIDKVFFVNQSVGWIIVHDSSTISTTEYRILRTNDGGKTFNVQWSATLTSYPKADFYIKFFDENNGYAIVADAFIKTDDGGKSWQDVSIMDGFTLYSVCFVNKDIGWADGTGNNNSVIVLKITNGGKSWAKQFEKDFSGPYSPAGGIDFINQNTGWFIIGTGDGSPGFIYQTTNGGSSFKMINNNINTMRPGISMLNFLNEKEGWISTAAGAAGVIGGLLYTSDGGKTFVDDYAKNTSLHNMNEIIFTTAKTGFALGDSMAPGCILRTTDSGKNWFQTSPVLPTNGISFIDAQYGFGIGSQQNPAALVSTSNGGSTWNIVYQFDLNKSLMNICFIDKDTGFAVLQDYSGSLPENLMKTVNGGKSWVKLYSFPLDAGLECFKMFNSKNGVFIYSWMQSNHFFQTNDDGVTWNEMPNAFTDISSKITMGSMNTGLSTKSLSQTINLMNNNALTQTLQLPDSCHVLSMDMKNNKAIAICENNNNYSSPYSHIIVISDDGGKNWTTTELPSETTGYLSAMENNSTGVVDILNQNEAYIFVPGYSFLYTSDGGRSWQWR